MKRSRPLGQRRQLGRCRSASPINRYSVRPLMANIASQKKRILRSERERDENRRLTGAVKTHFRRLESAVESGDSGRDRRASTGR